MVQSTEHVLHVFPMVRTLNMLTSILAYLVVVAAAVTDIGTYRRGITRAGGDHDTVAGHNRHEARPGSFCHVQDTAIHLPWFHLAARDDARTRWDVSQGRQGG